jgi:hypothetical protein
VAAADPTPQIADYDVEMNEVTYILHFMDAETVDCDVEMNEVTCILEVHLADVEMVDYDVEMDEVTYVLEVHLVDVEMANDFLPQISTSIVSIHFTRT